MKVQWQDHDIKYGRAAKSISANDGVIIGYDPLSPNSDSKTCIISLSDGLIVTQHKTKTEVAEWLTNNNYLPLELLP